MAIIPHPVLEPGRSDYREGCDFTMAIDTSQRTMDEKLHITGRFTLKSRSLQRLINNKKAEFFVLIKCSRTYKRYTHRTTDTEMKLNLPLGEYADKVIISPFIASTTDIDPFKSTEHNEEFDRIPIAIPAGAILAVGLRYEFTVDSLRTFGAAINLTTDNRLNDGEYRIDLNDLIDIQMNEKTRHKAQRLRVGRHNSLFPALYMPVLAHALMNMDDMSDTKWAKALNKTLTERNIDVSEVKSIPYVFAQKLLKYPLQHILPGDDDE